MTNAEWMQQTNRKFSGIAVMRQEQLPHYVIFYGREIVGSIDLAPDHVSSLTTWLDEEHKEMNR